MEVDVAEVEPHELADAQAARVEHLEDRPVAQRRAGRRPRTAPSSASTSASVSAFGIPCGTRGAPTSSLGSEPSSPSSRQNRWNECTAATARGDRRRRVAAQAVVVRACVAELVDVPGDGRFVDGTGRRLAAPAQVVGVAPQVAPVRGERVGREPALDAQPRVVLGEQTGSDASSGSASASASRFATINRGACSAGTHARQHTDDALGVDQRRPLRSARRPRRAGRARWSSRPPRRSPRRARASSSSVARNRWVYSSQKPGEL